MTEVDFTGHRVRPPHVLKAVLLEDKASLREYGRRGALSRARKRARTDSTIATTIHQFVVTEALFIGAVRTLDELRNRWQGAQRFLRPYKGRMTPKSIAEIQALRDAFITRGRWLHRDIQCREEYDELARERNEHICPIDD